MTSSQPDELITPTNKRSRQTQNGSSKDKKKMAKCNGNWLNPTPISNRFSSLQQEDDLVNQQTPGKEATPKPPPIYITSVTSIPHYFNYLIKSSQSFMKSKPWHKTRLKSNLNLLTLTA
jgi:hypothetical protein